ncbi:MAG TPA: thiolase family protein [Myxococcaceae bacterium]|jgi:acetyl-CoA acetyltransferase family protein
MSEALIIDAVRTPRGKRKGSLAGIHAVDLAAHVLNAALERTGVPPAKVEDVVLGCVTQMGEQAFDVARGAVLAAGMPIAVPGKTVNRLCGSGLTAVADVASGILSGQIQLGIGGGIESMTRLPMGSDAGFGDGPTSPRLAERFPDLTHQGLSAELMARKWSLGRGQLDEFAAASQGKAVAARAAGWFRQEIVPVPVRDADGSTRLFADDEHPRPGTTVETLAALKPSFREDGVIHAGNASGIVDGAAAVVVASREAARALGLRPRARVVTTAVVGSDPVLMLTGPIPSTRLALERAGWTADDVDLWEINEAFAPVPIVVGQELGIPLDRINVQGGAIALGHPLGATGAMLLATLLGALERRSLRRGAVTLCIGYGMGITMLVERLEQG